MNDMYSEIIRALEKREKVALATLIHRAGSAPRAIGAKYLIKEEGTAYGTIGGGRIEAEVWQAAQEVVKKGEGNVLHFKLTAEQLSVCGGDIDIFIEPLKEEYLNIYREVMKLKRKGGSAILVTLVSLDGVFPLGKESKVLIKTSGERVGSLFDREELKQRVLQESGELLKEKKPRMMILNSERKESAWKKMEILLEPIFSEPTLYIFGAGHISQQLAPLAKRVQFKVVIIDDREMFANRERFPESDEIIVLDFERCFDQLHIDESSYIVIVTRGHLYDGIVLEQAVRTPARYIGMIGSKKKIQILYQNLAGKGISKEILNQVYAPIGLDINSETPEEIAISIVAELIKVRGTLQT